VERVGEHPVPAGPLAVRWLEYELPTFRAGARTTARLALENAGSATWRSRDDQGVRLAYHWLDDRDNPIVWDGTRTAFATPVEPGGRVELEVAMRAPHPPGRYRLAFDLVEEHRFWFAEIGSHVLTLAAVVEPRIAERRLAVVVHGGADADTDAALAAQEEPLVAENAVAVAHLVPGALPAPDWSRRLLDAHAEGFAAVGGSLAVNDRRRARTLQPWSRPGRNVRFERPLLLPSLVNGLAPGEHEGLPAYAPDGEEPCLYDGGIEVTLRPPRGRPQA
jgi:hypothetical protein